MKLRTRMYLRKRLNEVKHTTLNPNGPGVVRIHLVPPKAGKEDAPAVVIINGRDLLPIKPSWSLLLAEFITQINYYAGKSLSEDDLRTIRDNTFVQVTKVFRKVDRDLLRDDLKSLMDTLCKIAYGEEVDEDIPYMSIGEYASYMSAPHRIDLMISSMTKSGKWHCNQRCVNCYAAGQTEAEVNELSTEEWKKIIDKCRAAYIPQITFTGGEPTMRNDLVELIDYSQWFVTRLNTNGILLSKELCKQLYEASLDSVQITLYSSDEAEHEALTGSCGTFKHTVQGIKNAIEAGLNVSINTPLCKGNSDYVKTLKFLHSLGVTYVSCSGIIFTGNARSKTAKEKQLTEDELFKILKEATAYCWQNDMEIAFTSPGQVSEEKLEQLDLSLPTCGACLSNMAIAPNGNVVPCQSWLNGNSVLGNMLSDPWKRIWNSPKALSIREFSARMEHTCPLKTVKEDK